jgi:hypothetical protein
MKQVIYNSMSDPYQVNCQISKTKITFIYIKIYRLK